MLTLGGVTVLPLQFGVIARDRDVVEFQVVQTGAAACGCSSSRAPRRRGAAARPASTARLRELGVPDPVVEVERRPALARPASGKLQIVSAPR